MRRPEPELVQQIRAMMEIAGFTPPRAARRLGMSERNVHRIARAHRIRWWDNDLLDTPEERPMLWEAHRDLGMSVPKIAWLFGTELHIVRDYFSVPRCPDGSCEVVLDQSP